MQPPAAVPVLWAAQKILGAHWGAVSLACARASRSGTGSARKFSSDPRNNNHFQAIYLSTDDGSRHTSPILLGMINFLERTIPHVGFFQPVSGASFPTFPGEVDRHVQLIRSAMNWKAPAESMVGVPVEEATRMIAGGKTNELLDKVYSAYESYKSQSYETVVIEGTDVGGTEFDALLAATLNAPVLLVVEGRPKLTANDYYSRAMLKRQVFMDHKVDVLGVLFNKVTAADHALIVEQLKAKFAEVNVPFAGAMPFDPLLATVRLDEVCAALGATLVHGSESHLDQQFNDVVLASQRVEELLEAMEDFSARERRPLVITSEDRLDVVLGLLSLHMAIEGPLAAGVLTTQASNSSNQRSYARTALTRIFKGYERAETILPVMRVDRPNYEVAQAISNIVPSILPSSAQKITESKLLFDNNVNMNVVMASLDRPMFASSRLTPKMFMHNIKKLCAADPQHIVLPEAFDQRILSAASEVTRRGLARVTLLGDPASVQAQAKKLGLDISRCAIQDPKSSADFDKYVEKLCEMRKHKKLTRGAAVDSLLADVNMFGTMMVSCGDADGMVSGAAHTTAATIRPALQLLRTPQNTLVSSVFFMCLPDKVLVYGDCAVNVSPTAQELAQIAITSADTAAAFGIEPRVAMLSYSTLGSGAGPDVQKVTEAVALVKKERPDLKVEGPIQYDAAVDPAVAAVKVKGHSEVAGKATVFIFPDLNTGNNTYKAVQQSTGAVAMGPVVQGLLKPVNDLSRGCTVPDVVNTICVTSILAQQAHKQQAAKA